MNFPKKLLKEIINRTIEYRYNGQPDDCHIIAITKNDNNYSYEFIPVNGMYPGADRYAGNTLFWPIPSYEDEDSVEGMKLSMSADISFSISLWERHLAQSVIASKGGSAPHNRPNGYFSRIARLPRKRKI